MYCPSFRKLLAISSQSSDVRLQTTARKSKGFTLVELLVVISIIAVLSAGGTAVYTNARNSALKAKRIADIDAIKKAYEKNYSPDLNGGQGGYKPLIGTDFASGSIPSPDNTNNTTYLVVGPTPGALVNNTVGSGATASAPSFAACVNLTDGSRCAASVSNQCYCAFSTQGEKLTTTSSSCDAFGVLNNGLVSYWKMDEPVPGSSGSWNANAGEVKDSSGNNNNGTALCSSSGCMTPYTVIRTPSQTNNINAGSFDGVDDYVNIGDPANLRMTNNFTISLFIKADTTQPNSFYNPISHGHTSSTGWVWQGQAGSLGVVFQPVGSASFSRNIRDNTWHHLVAVKSSTSGINLYFDGNPDNANAGATGNVILTPSGNINIGRDSINFPRNFKGLLDEVRIYNRPLTSSEVSLLYSGGSGCI